MESLTIQILGCGASLPSATHWPSSQAITLRGKVYLMDCGEGAQVLLRRAKVNFSRIVAIFISHMHGDHVFGLPGLLSSLALLGRTGTLHIYGPKGIDAYIKEIAGRFLAGSPYPIEVHEHEAVSGTVIFEDASMRVTSLALEHRIPTTGYLFEEKCAALHLNKTAVDFYQVPIAKYSELLIGAPYITPDGREIPNKYLTKPGRKGRRYAYCSDTSYLPQLAEYIQEVDLLYHEATYTQTEEILADTRGHSTAQQAAMVARLSNAKQLLLGHFSTRYANAEPLLQEARDIFPNTEAAYEGMCIEL